MGELSAIQWAALLAAAAVAIWPRLGSIKELLGGLLSNVWPKAAKSADPTDEDRVAAYRLLAPLLPTTLAAEVWTQLRPGAGGQPQSPAYVETTP